MRKEITMTSKLAGKAALVTGGSSGIGRRSMLRARLRRPKPPPPVAWRLV